jgi:tetratricopeptide (TPR) repeat protein
VPRFQTRASPSGTSAVEVGVQGSPSPLMAMQPDDATPSTSGRAWTDSWREQPASRPVVTKEQVEIHRRAKAAQSQGKRHAALLILHAGLARFPHDTHLLSLAASLEAKSGNRAAAEGLLRVGLRVQPGHLALLTTAARLHAGAGEFDAAREMFRAAHEANPQQAPVLQVRRVHACAARGPHAHPCTHAVARCLHPACILTRAHPVPLNQAWAMMEASAGNERAARVKFSEALSRAPGMPHVYCAWARMEAALGDVQRAREVFEEGCEAVPGHPPLLHVSAVQCGRCVHPLSRCVRVDSARATVCVLSRTLGPQNASAHTRIAHTYVRGPARTHPPCTRLSHSPGRRWRTATRLCTHTHCTNLYARPHAHTLRAHAPLSHPHPKT